jgi:hypothetical protein
MKEGMNWVVGTEKKMKKWKKKKQNKTKKKNQRNVTGRV